MASIDLQSLRALLLALVLMLCLHGCARSAEPGEAASPDDVATAQSAASSVAPPQAAADTTWACPPEVDGPVISLHRDTSERYGGDSLAFVPTSGDFKGRHVKVYWTGKLNGDSVKDIALVFPGLAGGWAESFIGVYAGCEDKRYVLVWGPDYAAKITFGKKGGTKPGWLSIHQQFSGGGENVYVFENERYTRLRDSH